MFWAYNESVIDDPAQPAGLENLASPDGFRALVRPYPVALAGTPEQLAFDPATRTAGSELLHALPVRATLRRWLPSVVHLPRLAYPDGYSVQVDGARVVSRRCSERLVLRAKPWARSVTVHVAPSAAVCGR